MWSKKAFMLVLLSVFLMVWGFTVSRTKQFAEGEISLTLGQTKSGPYTVSMPAVTIGDAVYVPIEEFSGALDKKAVVKEQSQDFSIEDTDIVSDVFRYQSTKFPLLACLPEQKIYLYGIHPAGVILYEKGEGHFFNWDYITPVGILPQICLLDEDKTTLAVILHTGSGTGYSMEELRVVTLMSNEYGRVCREYRFSDFEEQIEKQISYHVNEKEHLLELLIGEQSCVLKLNEEATFQEIHFNQIVEFSFQPDQTISAAFGISVGYEEYASPETLGELKAEVKFQNGVFTLGRLFWENGEK